MKHLKVRTTVALPSVTSELTATNTHTRETVEGGARAVLLEATEWVADGDVVVIRKIEKEVR